MAFRVSESHLWSKSEEEVRSKAFQELFCPANAHGAWQRSHAMNVVWLNIELVEGNLVALRRLHETDGVKVFIVDLPEDLIAVFRAPLKDPEVGAIRMAIAMVVGFHKKSLRKALAIESCFRCGQDSTCLLSL